LSRSIAQSRKQGFDLFGRKLVNALFAKLVERDRARLMTELGRQPWHLLQIHLIVPRQTKWDIHSGN